MYRFLSKYNCYRNTYEKPFLIRVVFDIELIGGCILQADNICQCDTWFPYDDSVKLKYNVVCDGELKPNARVIQKSIIVDISSIQNDDFDIELIITNLAGLTDRVNWRFSQLQTDELRKVKLNA